VFVKDDTSFKVKFCEENDYELLFEEIDRKMVEKKYGGLLKNSKVFWPPKNCNSLNVIHKVNSNIYIFIFKNEIVKKRRRLISKRIRQ